MAYQTSQMQRQDPLMMLLPLLLLAFLGPGRQAPAARPAVTDVCPPDVRTVRPRCGPVSSGTPLRAAPGTVRVIT